MRTNRGVSLSKFTKTVSKNIYNALKDSRQIGTEVSTVTDVMHCAAPARGSRRNITFMIFTSSMSITCSSRILAAYVRDSGRLELHSVCIAAIIARPLPLTAAVPPAARVSPAVGPATTPAIQLILAVIAAFKTDGLRLSVRGHGCPASKGGQACAAAAAVGRRGPGPSSEVLGQTGQGLVESRAPQVPAVNIVAGAKLQAGAGTS